MAVSIRIAVTRTNPGVNLDAPGVAYQEFLPCFRLENRVEEQGVHVGVDVVEDGEDPECRVGQPSAARTLMSCCWRSSATPFTRGPPT